MEHTQKLKDQLLMTLSFFEPMTMEFIYLDLDQNFLLENPDMTVENLHEVLSLLVKEKKVKKLKNPDRWIRVHPKKSLLGRLKRLFR